MSQLKDIGFHLIYPDGCKEVHEGLKLDELKRRLSDMIKRLENISDEFGKGQDSLLNETQIEDYGIVNSTDLRSANLQGLMLHLSGEQFMDHRDSEVQVRVALSLCYIIKIACPRNPFLCYPDTDVMTKTVLKFLLKCVKELARMKSKGDKLFLQVYTVLSICCEIDIFHFYTTVSEGESILSDVFHTFFEIVRRSSDWGEDQMLNKMISDAMVNLLSSPEAPISETLVTYLLNMLVDRCSSKVQKSIVLDVFTKCINKLEEQIQMVLQNFLIKNELEEDVSSSSDIDDDNNDDDEFCSMDSYKLMHKRSEKIKSKANKVIAGKNTIETNLEYGCHHVFHMIFEMFQINESIVMPLLPTIEMKLRSTNVTDRKRACRLIGKLFASSGSNDNPNQFSLWETFIGRFRDIEIEVREIWLRVARDLLKRALECPDNCGIMTLAKEKLELVKQFQNMSNDNEESIRYLIVLAVSQILEQSRTIVQEEELDTISDAMLKLLLHQSRDKFLSVRKEAMTTIGKLYRKIISWVEDKSNENGEVDVTLGLRHLRPGQKVRAECLLNMLLRQYTSTEVDNRIMVERLFNTSLVPYGHDSSGRMKSLLQCLTLCDEGSVDCINEMFKTQVNVMNIIRQTVSLLGEASSDQAMSPALSQKLREKVKKLSDYLSSKDKVDSLTKLFNQARSDKRLMELLRRFVDKESTRQVIVKTIMDIRKHFLLNAAKTAADTTAAATTKRKAFVATVKCIFERGAPIIFDVECVHEILSHCVSAKEVLESSSTVNKNMVPLSRILRLLHTLMLMSRRLVPLHDAYGYLALVLVPLSPTSSSSLLAAESPKNTVEELCLLVLSKMVECAPLADCESDTDETDGHHHHRHTTLFTECTEDVVRHTIGLLPYLERRCLVSDADGVGANLRRKKKDHKSQLGNERVELSKWKYDCKVAKLVSVCLVGLVRSCQYEVRVRHNDNGDLVTLADRLLALLSDVVKACRECETHSVHQPVMLTSLTHISINLSHEFEKDIRAYMKDIVANLLEESGTGKTLSTSKNLTLWQPEADVSIVTQVRIQALKLLSRWVVTLNADVVADKQCIICVMSCLRKYIGNYGTEGYTGDTSDREMSHLRLAAGKCWLRIAQVQSFLPIFDVMWIYRLSSLVHDPCPQVRNDFLRKLHGGLSKLSLPLEYMAMFVFVSKVKNQEYLNVAKKYLQTNIVRRREFLDTFPEYLSDAKKLFGLLPEYVLSFVIHMLAHDPDWTEAGNDESLGDVKQCLWFVMEPILKMNDNYSFIRKLLERIKHAQDATDPANVAMNEKMYICSDIALGLLISKQSSFDLKDYPVELKLPRTRYVPAPHSFSNPDFSSILLDNCTRARIQFSPTPKSKQTIRNCMPAVLIKGHCVVTDVEHVERGEHAVHSDGGLLHQANHGHQEGTLLHSPVAQSPARLAASTRLKKHVAKIVMGVPEMESEGIAGLSLPRKRQAAVRRAGGARQWRARDASPQSDREEEEKEEEEVCSTVTKRGRLCRPNRRVTKDMVSPVKRSILDLEEVSHDDEHKEEEDEKETEEKKKEKKEGKETSPRVKRKKVPSRGRARLRVAADERVPKPAVVTEARTVRQAHSLVQASTVADKSAAAGRPESPRVSKRATKRSPLSKSAMSGGPLASPPPAANSPPKSCSPDKSRVTRTSVTKRSLSSPISTVENVTQTSTSKTDSSTPKSTQKMTRVTRKSVSTPIPSVEPAKTDSSPASPPPKVSVSRKSTGTPKSPAVISSQNSLQMKESVNHKSTPKSNSSTRPSPRDRGDPTSHVSPRRGPQVKSPTKSKAVISVAISPPSRGRASPLKSPIEVTIRSKRLASQLATGQLVKKMKLV